MTRRERWWLVAVVVVAAALRLGWALWAARPPAGLHDPAFYLLYGEQLASGHGYRLPDGSPTAYYPPGYPFSLAPFFWLLDRTPLPDTWQVGTAALLNVVWQLVLVVVVFLVSRRIAGGVVAGLVAAAVVAVWPNLVFHTSVALTESLFLVLLAVVLLLAVSAPWEERRLEPWRLAAIGTVVGVATLVRPVTLPLVPIVLVALLVARAGWRRALGHTAVVAACAAAVVAPWVVRNAVVMDAVTLSTNTGDNLCMSRRPGGSGGFELPNERCFPSRFDAMPRPAAETRRDAHGRRLALAFVRDRPAEELRLVLRRAVRTFDGDADGIAAAESYGDDVWLGRTTRRALTGVAGAYGAVVALVALPGLWLLARRSAAGLLVVLTGLAMLVPPLVFFGDPRFHVPAAPVAAVAVGALVARAGRRRQPDAVRTPCGAP